MVHLRIWQVTAPVHERARWASDRGKVERRINRWRQKRWFDAKAEAFSLSKGRVEDDDDYWEVRLLLRDPKRGLAGYLPIRHHPLVSFLRNTGG